MTTTNVTVAQVRSLTGIDDTLVTDEIIQATIDRVCGDVEDYFSIKTTPTKAMDFINVADEFQITIKKVPLLSVSRIQQNNTNIELTNIQFNSIGTIRDDFRRFYNNSLGSRNNNMLYVEYYYGWLEEADTKEFTTEILLSGTGVNITVSDSTDYTVGNWIRVKGFDGNQEVTKISALPDSTTITVDNLVYEHEINSIIENLITPSIIEQYILQQSSYDALSGVIGGTYTLATGYTIEGVSVQKGVAYTHFQRVLESVTKQRDIIIGKINGSLITIG